MYFRRAIYDDAHFAIFRRTYRAIACWRTRASASAISRNMPATSLHLGKFHDFGPASCFSLSRWRVDAKARAAATPSASAGVSASSSNTHASREEGTYHRASNNVVMILHQHLPCARLVERGTGMERRDPRHDTHRYIYDDIAATSLC